MVNSPLQLDLESGVLPDLLGAIYFFESSSSCDAHAVRVSLLCSVRTKGRCVLTPLPSGTQTFPMVLKARERVKHYYVLVHPPKSVCVTL